MDKKTKKLSKEEILNASIRDLGISNYFTKYFFKNRSTTISDLISLNPGLILSDTPLVIGRNLKLDDLKKKTVHWKHLAKFLVDNGFNFSDWLALLPNNDISLLRLDEILDLPFYFVAGMKFSCEPMTIIARHFIPAGDRGLMIGSEEEVVAKRIKVRDVLQLSAYDIRNIIANGRYDGGAIEIGIRKTFRLALDKAQAKLRSLNFDSNYGIFMDTILYPKNQEEMVKYLSQNTNLKSEEAKMFLHLAAVAGIKIDQQFLEK